MTKLTVGNKNWLGNLVVSGLKTTSELKVIFPLLNQKKMAHYAKLIREGMGVSEHGRPLKINEEETQKIKNKLKKMQLQHQEAATQQQYMTMLAEATTNTAEGRGRIAKNGGAVSATYSKDFKHDNDLTNRKAQSRLRLELKLPKILEMPIHTIVSSKR